MHQRSWRKGQRLACHRKRRHEASTNDVTLMGTGEPGRVPVYFPAWIYLCNDGGATESHFMTMDKWFYGKLLSISNTTSQRCHYMGKPRRTKVRTTNMERYEVVLEWYPVHATCWTEFKDQGKFWKFSFLGSERAWKLGLFQIDKSTSINSGRCM